MKSGNPEQVIERQFELKWRIGMRTAVLISSMARRYDSQIEFLKDDLNFDAKVLLAVGLLAEPSAQLPSGRCCTRTQAGTTIVMRISGPDAQAAAAAFEELFGLGDRVAHCRNSDCTSSAILTAYNPSQITYSCSNGHSWLVSRDSGLISTF